MSTCEFGQISRARSFCGSTALANGRGKWEIARPKKTLDDRSGRGIIHAYGTVSIAGTDEQEGSVHRRCVANLKAFVVLLAAISLAGVTLAGQTVAPKDSKVSAAPRSPDGRPDLSGIWEHNAATPLERPDEIADRATLTFGGMFRHAILCTNEIRLYIADSTGREHCTPATWTFLPSEVSLLVATLRDRPRCQDENASVTQGFSSCILLFVAHTLEVAQT